MTDHHDHDHGPGGDDELFFTTDPEQAQAFIEAARAKARMAYEDLIHSIYRMIEDMPLEHLRLVRSMMHNLGQEPQALGYWEGIFSATIARRENVCPACGRDHDKDAAALVEASKDDVNVRGDRLIKMTEYHVEPSDDDDLWGKVVCTGIAGFDRGCGMEWPNLEDRVLRSPEECHGCQTKSAHG